MLTVICAAAVEVVAAEQRRVKRTHSLTRRCNTVSPFAALGLTNNQEEDMQISLKTWQGVNILDI
jgi:hypothetical protein